MLPDRGEPMRRECAPICQRLKLMRFNTQEATVPLSVINPKSWSVFGFTT
jgi:hypothetical protein